MYTEERAEMGEKKVIIGNKEIIPKKYPNRNEVCDIIIATKYYYGDKCLEALKILNNKIGHNDVKKKIEYVFNKSNKNVDFVKALYIYRRLATNGNTFAQYTCGYIYDNPDESYQNYREAYKWYKLAAEKNHPIAQYKLAILYECARGVEKNKKASLFWYNSSAIQGYEPAQYSLGYNYHNGICVRKKYSTAIKWYMLSIAQGNKIATIQCNKISEILYNIGIKYYKKSQYKQALFKLERASNLNNANALKKMGDIYYNGNGVKNDYKKAYNYYILSEKNGNKSIYYDIGLMLYYGQGCENNYIKAMEYFKQSSDINNDNRSQYMLMLMFKKGISVEKNPIEELRFLKLSAQNGNNEAQYLLGNKYKYDDNYKEAVKWYELSAPEYVEAQYELGLVYYYGYGVDEDEKEAMKYFNLASARGHKQSVVYMNKKLKKKKDGDNLCVICFELTQKIEVLVPCGHRQYCSSCIQKIDKCSVCRTKIQQVIRIY